MHPYTHRQPQPPGQECFGPRVKGQGAAKLGRGQWAARLGLLGRAARLGRASAAKLGLVFALLALAGPGAQASSVAEPTVPAVAVAAVPAAVAAMPAAAASSASAVRCHIAFAGAARSFTVAPIAHGQAPEPLLQGASFMLEVINRLPPDPGAGVKVRTHGFVAEQPVLLHQAWFLHTTRTGPHGFTGLQVVREPQRGHELSYWCERAE